METINYTREEENFMKEKSIEIINKTHNINLELKDVDIKLKRLEGISNKIYNIQIKEKENSYDLFFKLFGKISSKKIKKNKKK
jgi:hypothetical protein